MQKPTVLFVAHDFAPSAALKQLAAKMHDDINGVSFLSEGKAPLSEREVRTILPTADVADVVVSGISSSPALAAEEIAASEVIQTRIMQASQEGTKPPLLAVYLDTDMGERPWYREELRAVVGLVFAPNDDEAKLARERFPNARVVIAGNPLEEAAAFPKFSRAEVQRFLGVHDNQTVTLAPGGKDFLVNNDFLKGIVDAVLGSKLASQDPVLIFSPHPGDGSDPRPYLDILGPYYNARLIASQRHFQPSHGQMAAYRSLQAARRIGMEPFSASELLPGCDIVVQSASTIGKEAARQEGGRPVVNYFTRSAFERNPDIRQWPPVERGVEAEVYEGPQALAETMARLLTIEGFAAMKKRQEEVYPRPAYLGEAVDKMAAALKECVS